MEEKEEIQFSIFKIDNEKVEEYIIVEADDTSIEIKNKIIEYIIREIKEDEVYSTNYDGFDLLLIKSIRFPVWKKLISEMFSNGDVSYQNQIEIQNESTSYILFYVVNNSIYVMTGGRGANYITKFIKTNYGLYLIPKIVNKNMSIIKKVHENNITGNNLSTERITKNITSVAMEDGIGSIYRELNIQLSKEIAKQYGISTDDSRSFFMIESGNALNIKKSISINELKQVLKKLEKLEKAKDNFILNYFVPIDKKNIKVKQVREIMYNNIIEGNINDFELLSDDIDNYYFNSSKYIIRDVNGKLMLESDVPIKLIDILELAKGKDGVIKRTKLEDVFLKYSIETVDESGEYVIYPQKVINLVRGCIQKEKDCFYLLNGVWYIFEEQFFKSIDEAYHNLFDNNISYESNIVSRYNLYKSKIKDEDTYNKSFKKRTDIIKGHEKEIKNIELADLIFFDEEKLYLMCNKTKFNGSGVRDLENQIQTSSLMLNSILKSERALLEEYYERLEDSEKRKISKADFMNLFSKKIVYIAGFKSGYKRNTRSPYAKHLICELKKTLKSRNQDLIIMNYSD